MRRCGTHCFRRSKGLCESSGQRVKCQFCESEVMTTIEYRNTLVGYILCFIVVLIFGIYGILISIFLFPLCRSANHRCPKCYNLIISNHFLGLPSLQDQVITLNIGSCAVIITRKILLVLFFTCSVIILLVFVMKHKIAGIDLQPTISNITWDDYRANCGTMAFLSNPREAVLKFLKDYKYMNVNWSGFVAKITVNANNHEEVDEHACALYIMMVPDDFENAVSFVVMLDKQLYNYHKNILANIEIGHKIEFNATLMGIGTDNNLMHLHGLGVKLLGEKREIPGELTSFGRYGPTERS
eukprot:TRINITY_DN14466_c0_g1_i24.p1 TRINITY_DN14466_c0_g1~~TRINITY_DN14466_c0_g1_i24.p1  ORF type:complete len:298 (+),score=45.72 TRINITY_DN14466_c0_g1_i24:725-1618(+)